MTSKKSLGPLKEVWSLVSKQAIPRSENSIMPVSLTSACTPAEDRLVRISRPSKNVMQSGTNATRTWKIDFNSQPRWENWLMGWTSSADPVSNLSLKFPTKEDAIEFCKKNEFQWYVEEQPERKIRRKSYADNFSWNKRTRLGNKCSK